MSKQNKSPVIRVHFVHEDVSLDKFVRGTLGCTLNELVRDVRGGKYDHLIKRKEGTVS